MQTQRSRIPTLHPNYNDQSSEIIKEMRLMNQYLLERINRLQDQLVALETFVNDERRREHND